MRTAKYMENAYMHPTPFSNISTHLTPIIVSKYDVSTDNLLTKRIRDLTWDYNAIPFQSRDDPMNDFDRDILDRYDGSSC